MLNNETVFGQVLFLFFFLSFLVLPLVYIPFNCIPITNKPTNQQTNQPKS